MPNPITVRARGIIYVIGVIVGGLAVIAGPLSIALGVSPEWTSVATSLLGAVVTLSSTLARANLTLPTDTDTTEG